MTAWIVPFFLGLKVNKLTMLYRKTILKVQQQRDCVSWITVLRPRKMNPELSRNMNKLGDVSVVIA